MKVVYVFPHEVKNSSFASCAAEELALSLSEALSRGDGQEAGKLCEKLSQLSVPVSVSVNTQAYPQGSIRWDTTVCMRVSEWDFLILFKCFQNNTSGGISFFTRAVLIFRALAVLN